MTSEVYKPGDIVVPECTIDEIIGEGGMGTVYLAHNEHLKHLQSRLSFGVATDFTWPLGIDKAADLSRLYNEVLRFAVKIPRKQIGYKALEAFTEECHIWISLRRNPYVVNAFRVDHARNIPVLFLEYIQGTNLMDWISRKQRGLDIVRSVDFAIQICKGLCHGYEDMGIVHRDIKPTNILVTVHNIAKVTDFGLAVQLCDNAHVSTSFEVAGTFEYMAPEQFEGTTDIHGDIYSFGIVLYEMLTGNCPFNVPIEKNAFQRYQAFKHSHAEIWPPNPSTIEPQVPKRLASLVLQCLEKNPQKRFANFRDILQELEEVSRELDVERIIIEREARAGRPRGGRILESLEENWSYMSPEDWLNKGSALKQLDLLDQASTFYDSGLDEIKRLELADEEPRGMVWLFPGNNLIARNSKQAEIDGQKSNGRSVGLMDRQTSKASLLVDKGLCLELTRHIDEASAIADQVLDLWKDFPGGLVLKSLVLKDRGDYHGAISLCDRVICKEPNNEWGWHNKGNCLGFLGQFEQAKKCFEKALSINPLNRLSKKGLHQALAGIKWGSNRQF